MTGSRAGPPTRVVLQRQVVDLVTPRVPRKPRRVAAQVGVGIATDRSRADSPQSSLAHETSTDVTSVDTFTLEDSAA